MHEEALLVARLFLGVPFMIWGVMKLRGGEAKLVPVLAGLLCVLLFFDPSAYVGVV